MRSGIREGSRAPEGGRASPRAWKEPGFHRSIYQHHQQIQEMGLFPSIMKADPLVIKHLLCLRTLRVVNSREPTVTECPPCADSGPEASPASSPLMLPTALWDRRHDPGSHMEKERELR